MKCVLPQFECHLGIFLCALKAIFHQKKGPHNGAQVDRGGQQDGGKLIEKFCRYARYSFHNKPCCAQPFCHIDSFQPQVHSVLHNPLCVFFFHIFHARRFLCVNDVLWFQLVAHCSSTTPASRASGLWESQLFHSSCTFWGNLCPLCSSVLWEEVLQDL